MEDDEFSVELHRDAAGVTIKARGDLELATVGRLRMALADACADPQLDVTVDLTEVQFFNALTVGALAVTARQVRRANCLFVVHGLTRLQEKILRISGLGYAIKG